jgi:hypothetical protein
MLLRVQPSQRFSPLSLASAAMNSCRCRARRARRGKIRAQGLSAPVRRSGILRYSFGCAFFWLKPSFEAARMTTKNLLVRSITYMGIGVVLACALWVCRPAAQAGARDDGTTPKITSAPGENAQGNGGIDYENAKPMPLPSLPDPAHSGTLPAPPYPGGIFGRPGSSPGGTGTGKENPRVLVPPKR